MAYSAHNVDNVEQMQTTSMTLNNQLREMANKIELLQNDVTRLVDKLKDEKNDIESEHALILEERDAQLAALKFKMQAQILSSMMQVRRHNKREVELLKENSVLKEKLQKERQDPLEGTSKGHLLKQSVNMLENEDQEQEYVLKEQQDAIKVLHRKIEELKDDSKRETKKIEEQKMKREAEFNKELESITVNLLNNELELGFIKVNGNHTSNDHMEQIKKENKLKIETMMKEKEELQKKLKETEANYSRSLEKEEKLKECAKEQEEESGKVISALKQQLGQMTKERETMLNKMKQVESDRLKEMNEMNEKLNEAETNYTNTIDEILSRGLEKEGKLKERIQKQEEDSSNLISTLKQQMEQMIKDKETMHKKIEAERNRQRNGEQHSPYPYIQYYRQPNQLDHTTSAIAARHPHGLRGGDYQPRYESFTAYDISRLTNRYPTQHSWLTKHVSPYVQYQYAPMGGAAVTERKLKERIQKQEEESSKVISTLKEQLEQSKKQLQKVEADSNTMLESLRDSVSSATQAVLSDLGDVVESELQCSICTELFIVPTTLNCAHTFCEYCITTWKKTKLECPICRARITTQCRGQVLHTFINKIVQSLGDEAKEKRSETLRRREAEAGRTN